MVLYLATGRRFARLEEGDGGWETRFALEDSGAQCLAVDPAAPATVHAGCRGSQAHGAGPSAAGLVAQPREQRAAAGGQCVGHGVERLAQPLPGTVAVAAELGDEQRN